MVARLSEKDSSFLVGREDSVLRDTESKEERGGRDPKWTRQRMKRNEAEATKLTEYWRSRLLPTSRSNVIWCLTSSIWWSKVSSGTVEQSRRWRSNTGPGLTLVKFSSANGKRESPDVCDSQRPGAGKFPTEKIELYHAQPSESRIPMY